MTQKQLAVATGLTQGYISSLEKNDSKKSPTLRTLEILSQALEVCPMQLLDRKCASGTDCCTCKYRFW